MSSQGMEPGTESYMELGTGPDIEQGTKPSAEPGTTTKGSEGCHVERTAYRERRPSCRERA